MIFNNASSWSFWSVMMATSLLGLSPMLIGNAAAGTDVTRKGIDIQRTGLIPRYPSTHSCSPLTSLYASWDDVDGTKRTEPHSGVDGGRLGEDLLAPAPGSIVAVWKADWGWGSEGAVLIRHSREDLGLHVGPRFYYSEFDHLNYKELGHLSEGARLDRGDVISTVSRPGGDSDYLPEVHWEVWQVNDRDADKWSINEHSSKYWTNKTAHLIDPLYMLSLNGPRNEDGSVDIQVYDPLYDYAHFKGFSYIFRCAPSHRSEIHR